MFLRQSLISLLTLAGVATIAGLFLTLQGRASAGPNTPDSTLVVGVATHHLVIGSSEVIAWDPNCTPVVGVPVGGVVGSAACNSYTGAINLPDGAVITEMTFYYNDTSAANARTALARSTLAANSDSITVFDISSSGTPGAGFLTDTGSLAIDNATYDYHLEIVLPDAGTRFNSAVLTYTIPVIVNGDVNCSSIVDAVDALGVLRHVAGLTVNQSQPCPPIGG